MKPFLFLFLFSLTLSGCSSDYNAMTIKKTDELISQRKYLSAFQNLEKADPKNIEIELLLKKIEVNLYYFVQSINHEAFVLVDLKPEDDLLQLRKNFTKGAFTWVIDIPKKLDSLKAIYPNNYAINLTLAFYYGEYYNRFGYTKVEKDSIVALIYKLNEEAFEHGVYSYKQCYELGVKALSDSSTIEKGIELLKKSLVLNNINDEYFLFYHTFIKSEAYYNLGFTSFSRNQNDLALKYLDTCLQYCKDSSYISDIYSLVGHISKEQNNKQKAIFNFEKALQFNGEKYNNYFSLLELRETTDDQDKYLNDIFQKNKESHLFIEELAKYYFNKDQANEIIYFYEKQLKYEKNNLVVFANLNFYIAELNYAINNLEQARYYYLVAKDKYMTYFKEKNNLILDIENAINEIDQKRRNN